MPRKPTKHTLTLKLDKLFSKLVRSIGQCERCGEHNNLQTAHIYSRRYRHVRWETLNAVCLCAKCHFWAHQNPVDFAKWVEGYLGAGTLAELRAKARSRVALSLEEMLEIYNQLLELESRG